jgi:hypothetical protein
MASAEPRTTPTPTATPTLDVNAQLAAALQQLADIQTKQFAEAKRREGLSYDEYLELHPPRVMPCQLFQNGIQIAVEQLTDEQLALLPKLREGRFFNRKIHVYRDATPDRGWHIDWPRKSMADRMAIIEYGRDFTEILERLTTETPDRS